MNIKDLLTFEKFLTPQIIKVVYWLALILIIVLGIKTVIQAISIDSATGLLVGVLFIVVGPIYIRVLCESILALFRIVSELSAIRGSTNQYSEQPYNTEE
jgi:hypothetical protein